MIESTRKKLREVAFFYSHLATVEGRIMRSELEALGFYLSAFLSASRSIADYLEAEEGDRYRAWFATRKLSLTDEEQSY